MTTWLRAGRRRPVSSVLGLMLRASRLDQAGEGGYCLVFVFLGVLDFNRVLLDEELRDWAR
jgi:hypothetical protein